MKIRTESLEGVALDWAVAVAVPGRIVFSNEACRHGVRDANGNQDFYMELGSLGWSPSTKWNQGGPLIEDYRVGLGYFSDGWVANAMESNYGAGAGENGDTQLVAAMRAIVAEVLGDEVEIPDDLAGGGE